MSREPAQRRRRTPRPPAIRVPYGQTVHGEEEIAAVVEVLRTSTQMGAHVRDFETRVAALFAKTHGIMVNSGSSANYLAVELLGLPAGAEVDHARPDLRDDGCAAGQASVSCPAFVDVEPDTFNIDVDQIEATITPKTRAMMIPSLIGNLPDWDRIAEIAAHARPARRRGFRRHARRDLARHEHRHALGHQHDELLRLARHQLRRQRRHALRQPRGLARRGAAAAQLGADLVAVRRFGEIENRFNVDVGGIPYDAKFVFSRIGYNLEPSEIGAAFGLVQLDRLRGEHRRARAQLRRAARASSRSTRTGSSCRVSCRTAAPAGWRSRSSSARTRRSPAATCRSHLRSARTSRRAPSSPATSCASRGSPRSSGARRRAAIRTPTRSCAAACCSPAITA